MSVSIFRCQIPQSPKRLNLNFKCLFAIISDFPKTECLTFPTTMSAFSPSPPPTQRAFISDAGRHVLVSYDLITGKKDKELNLLSVSTLNAIAVSGGKLIVVEGKIGLTFVDTATLTVIKRLDIGGVVLCVAWSDDGKYIAAGLESGEVCLIDPVSHAIISRLPSHTNAVRTISFSPSSNLLVSGSSDMLAIIHSSTNLNKLHILTGHTNVIYCTVFMSDDKVATGGQDNAIRIWDVASGKPLKLISDHSNWVMSLARSPDGKFLVSGGHDKMLNV